MGGRRWFGATVVVCALLAPMGARAQTPTQRGVTWLLSEQAPDGSFGASTGENRVLATSEAVLALRDAGMGASGQAQAAELWLSLQHPTALDLVARRLRVLRGTALQDDAGLAALRAEVLSQGPSGPQAGFGPGWAWASPVGLSLALAALVPGNGGYVTWVPRATGASEVISLERPALALLRMGRDGWGLVDGGPDPTTTARVVLALRPFRRLPGVGASLDAAAVAQILAHQAPSGAIGDGSQPIIDTARGLQALEGLDQTRIVQDLALAGARGQAWLEGAQANDGSWGGGVYQTALVLRALSTRRPDYEAPVDELGQTYIALSPTAALANQQVTARLTIKNASTVPAPATTVRLTAAPTGGGAPLVLAEVPIDALGANGSAPVSLIFSTTGMKGEYQLTATADPDNRVAETNEANNAATATFRVVRAVNLAVGSTDIHFQPASGGLVQVSATVHSQGDSVRTPFDVVFYQGAPGSGGVVIGTATIPSLAGGAQATVSVDWDASSIGGPATVYVVVDPAGVVNEMTRADNRAFRIYFPGAQRPVQLAVYPQHVQTPNPAYPGQTVDVTVPVHNLGSADAERVPVVLETAAGNVMQETEVSRIPAGGVTDVHFSVVLQHRITVVVEVDPDGLLNDTYRYDNSAHFDLLTSGEAYPIDVSISQFGGADYVGPPRTVDAKVQEMGTKTVDTSVALFRGDPVFGDATEIARKAVHLRGVAHGVGGSAYLVFPGIKVDNDDVFTVCVDPDHKLADRSRADNCRTTTASTGRSDVAIATNDIKISPVGPNVGEPMTVEARIREVSGHDASGVARLWQGLPRQPGSRVLGQRRFQVTGGSQTHVSWRLLRPAGDTNLWVALVDVTPRDESEFYALKYNNYGMRNVFLKALVDTGRRDFTGRFFDTGGPVVGDIQGTGHPAIVFSEDERKGFRLTAVSLDPDGTSRELWSTVIAGTDRVGNEPILVDITGNGKPDVVDVTHSRSAARTSDVDVVVLDGFGKMVWKQAIPNAITGYFDDNLLTPAVADVNGDGVPDLVLLDGGLLALDGKTGKVLWRNPTYLPNIPSATGYVRAMDMDGDGTPEIVVGTFARSPWYSSLAVFDNHGKVIWVGGQGVTSDDFGLVDLDLDGRPDIVTTAYRGWVGAANGTTGAQLWHRSFDATSWTLAVGDLRQDGLAYPVEPMLGLPPVAAFRPSGSLLWFHSIPGRPPFYDGQQVALADLLGLGRPQIVATSPDRTLNLYDGRTGKTLLTTEDYRGNSFQHLPPVIADVDGDGHGDVVIANGNTGGTWDHYDPSNTYRHTPANLEVYSSVHWKRMPAVWNRRFYVKGEVDAHLHFLGDYQPWKTHNTWVDQFYGSSPAKLLADLTVGTQDIVLAPTRPAAGDAAQVQVTVHNVGGLPASNVAVEVWDGDPKDGGHEIGTATAAGPLPVRGGTATVSVPWTAYPEGEHHLYAVVNPAHAIEESGYENNEAHGIELVTPGTNLADLAVAASGMAVTPGAPLAGSRATIATKVTNLGVRPSGAFTVAWYDGVPRPGLAPLATAQAADLPAAAAETVTAPVVLGPGAHELYVVADPAQATPDADRSNNIAWMVVTARVPAQPELTVPVLTAGPATVIEGRTTTLTAKVANLGQAVTSPVVRFYLGDPAAGGQAFGDVRIRGLVGTGQTATATATLDTHGLAGTRMVYAVVDPDNVIAESREDDNTASTTVTVTAPPVTLTVAADRATYGANTAATLTATVAEHTGTARDVKVDVRLERPDGSLVAVPGQGLDAVVAANGTWPVTASWDTGTTPAGDYVVHAVARDATGVLAEARTGLTILPDEGLFARVTMDKTGYLPGDTALVTTLLRDDGVNAPVGPFTSVVTITGGGMRWQATRQVPALSPGEDRTALDAYPVSPDLAPGTYQVGLVVTDSAGTPVTTDATQLVVEATTPATGLSASVVATPSQPAPGMTVDVAVTFTNHGNTQVTGAPVTLAIRDPQTLAVIATVAGTVTVAPRLSAWVDLPWRVAGVTPPADVLATVEVGGRILGKTVIHVIKQVDTTPPVVTVTGVSDGEVTSKDVTPVITATDASPFTMAVSLDGLAYAQGTAIKSEGDHVLSIVATDIYGNRTKLNIAFAIDHTPPVVSLTGVSEGEVTNAASVTVSADATDLHLDSALLKVDGTIADSATGLAGKPYHHDLTFTDEGDYTVYLSARDEAQLGAEVTRHFAIDRTPPTVALTGIADGKVVNAASVTVHATASDLHFASATLELDGAVQATGTAPGPFSHDLAVTAEGDYTVDLSAADAAGNTASAHLGFAVDRTPPTIAITGIPARYTPLDVTPEVKVTDAHLDPKSVVITLNGAPFTPGTLVHDEGDYHLVVTAADLAGNTATATADFTIDRTPPTITITGVTEGELSMNVVKPVVTVTDRNLDPAAVSVTLNGVPYVSGTAIGADGVYTLAVQAADLAGNTASAAVHFEVFQVHVTLTSGPRVGNALILSPCGQCSCPAPPVLAGALADAKLPGTVVATEDQWRDGVRTGLYDTLVLYRSDEGEDDLDDEVVELVRQGLGLVVVSGDHSCEDEPHLAEALGARTRGKVQGATTLAVAKSDLGPAESLDFAGDATAQKLAGATAVGTTGGEVVLSIHQLGAGKVAYLTFDPEAAPTPAAMSALLGEVLTWVRPAKLLDRVPEQGVVLDHTVDNTGPARDYTLTQGVPTGTVVLSAPQSSAVTPAITWPLSLKLGETALRWSAMRLPDAAGTSAFPADLDVLHPVRGPLPVGHSVTKVTVPEDLATLTQAALDAVAALPRQCHDHDEEAAEVLKHLAASPSTREEAAETLEKLVHAAEALGKLGAQGATARDAVDRLIRAWEAQWSALPPDKDDHGKDDDAACEAKGGEAHE